MSGFENLLGSDDTVIGDELPVKGGLLVPEEGEIVEQEPPRQLPPAVVQQIMQNVYFTPFHPEYRDAINTPSPEKDKERLQTLLKMMKTCKEWYKLGLPLFVRKIDLEMFTGITPYGGSDLFKAQPLVQQFSKDRLASGKFTFVKELLNLGAAELTDAEMSILSKASPQIEKLKIHFPLEDLQSDPNQFEKRAVKLWTIVNSCRTLRDLEVVVDRYNGPRRSFDDFQGQEPGPPPVIQLFQGAAVLPFCLRRVTLLLPLPVYRIYGPLSATARPFLASASKLPQLQKFSISYDPLTLDLSSYRNLLGRLEKVEIDASAFNQFMQLQTPPRHLILDNATWLRYGGGEEFEDSPDLAGAVQVDLSRLPGIETIQTTLLGSHSLLHLPTGLKHLILDKLIMTTPDYQLGNLKKSMEDAFESGLKSVRLELFGMSEGDRRAEIAAWKELKRKYAGRFIKNREFVVGLGWMFGTLLMLG